MAENKYEELWAELKKYLTLQIDYAKLTTVEKLVVLLSAIAMVAVMLILGACVLFYLSFALVVILLQMTQSVVAQQNVALCPEKPKLVLMLVVYALRQKLILDPVSRFLTRLFLHHK